MKSAEASLAHAAFSVVVTFERAGLAVRWRDGRSTTCAGSDFMKSKLINNESVLKSYRSGTKRKEYLS
ncbi:hypothetical protein RR46_14756 [Papilio xuthus]|uniref:Uncharacterized protein n=1 Tax=Papilio xuthus TaxID=66420 RepID=A0A194PDD0_PAPXU|nr:hypothetical protein RR46_14756 [Papilio xuthus]